MGPLADLAGTWTGDKGWNIVALPDIDNPHSFILLSFNYTETLTFTEIGDTPNRGTTSTQYTNGFQYEQVITEISTNSIVHKENGLWLISWDPSGPYPIARTSSIPHGDVLLAQGNATTISGAPTFEEFSVLPQLAESFGSGYTAPYYNMDAPFPPENMNAFLQAQIENQKITTTTHLSVSSLNEGGVLNIPFIVEQANVNVFTSDFYIETVSQNNGQTFLQLQYTQNSAMTFLANPQGELVIWPHGQVNTLRKVSN